MITAKIGRVRSQRCDDVMGGRARSDLRSMRGPDPGLGAATTLRLGVTWFLKSCRKVYGRIRGRENMVTVVELMSNAVDANTTRAAGFTVMPRLIKHCTRLSSHDSRLRLQKIDGQINPFKITVVMKRK